jgi:non-homologous end joining protein Ku
MSSATSMSRGLCLVQLAKERQTSRYDPSDLEDRCETRLRAMIEAKPKGEGN